MSSVTKHITNITLLGLLTLLLSFCSKPTAPGLDSQVILRRMLGFPAIPFPPETAENITDFGFTCTKGYCQFLADIREPFEKWLKILLDEDIPAVQKEHSLTVDTGDTTFVWTTLTWTRTFPGDPGGSKFTLEVKLTSKWYFEMDWTGPVYARLSPNSLSGWIIPDAISGYVYNNWRHLYWKPDLYEMDFYVETGSVIYAVSDSIWGGGHFTLWDSQFRIWGFSAKWDTLGHGSWRSATDSGEW